MEFTLRKWKPEDASTLMKYANNPKIAANLTDQFPHPYKRENAEAFIAMAMKNEPLNIFAIDVNGEAIGGIGLHFQQDIHKKNMELGYWVAEPFWGKGIMTKAVLQIVEYGFKTFDMERVFARPFGTNIGSQKVLEKAGFILEARLEKTLYKNGEFLDELIYAVRRESLSVKINESR